MSGGTSEKSSSENNQSVSKVNEPIAEYNQVVTEQALQLAWKEYSQTIEKENPRLFSILNNKIPTLENGTKVKLELHNQMQENELMKEKNTFFTVLKNKLKNHNLELHTIIIKEDLQEQTEVFTASDKLRVMMEQYPALAKLKQHFNLDLE